MSIRERVISGKEITRSDSQLELPLERQLDAAPMVTVAVGSLRAAASSPRLSGESMEHIRLLAQSNVLLPPIIVHRETMRVIDGMHRLGAARLRGEQEIQARFYDGTAADAFVLAVKANRAHGLPLSLADRKAAAARIIASHPQWSDRGIAEVTALSHKTVGAIRRRLDGEIPQVDARMSQDGRMRPINAAVGRSRAAELLKARPGASLRQVAAAAGISPETARDVRTRLRNGGDPLLPRQRDGRRPGPLSSALTFRRDGIQAARAGNTGGPASIARKLRRDPALRSCPSIQALVRLLALNSSDPAQWEQLAVAVPSRWAAPVATAAAECAQAWNAFAVQVRQHAAGPPDP
ncbi:MAG TPA: ParB N-terminal domain-containing protein [Streptosporangiaceae bacterium]